MTDDINDVRYTSTLAKFEESVRRSSPVSETDIVLRLRHLAKLLGVGHFDIPARLNEAATEIERCHADIKALMEQCGDQFAEIERLRGVAQEPAAFYGAQCPSYPACSGGCGLGCTHEIELAQRGGK
jgi:hypothetical protein